MSLVRTQTDILAAIPGVCNGSGAVCRDRQGPARFGHWLLKGTVARMAAPHSTPACRRTGNIASSLVVSGGVHAVAEKKHVGVSSDKNRLADTIAKLVRNKAG
jgi:hypothetical protein